MNFARFLTKLEKYLYDNYRNLPTGDTFSRGFRAFITGNDNMDALNVKFVKALFAPDVSMKQKSQHSTHRFYSEYGNI